MATLYDYNTNRTHLLLKEYGRNVQMMVNHITQIKDKEEKNEATKVLVEMMRQLNPNIKDNVEFERKIWDDIIVASDYKLDIDTPFGRPSPKLEIKKNKTSIPYTQKEIKFKHYGKNTDMLIKKASQLVDGGDKEVLIHHIAKLMKAFYMSWNKKIVDDSVILRNISDMSNGKINIDSKDFQDKPLEELYKDSVQQNSLNGNNNRSSNKSRKRIYNSNNNSYGNRKDGQKNSNYRPRKSN